MGIKLSIKLSLLLSIVLNFAAWQVIVPVWHFPDEQAHFGQVAFFAENGRFQRYKELSTNLEITRSEEILGTKRDGMGNNRFTYNPDYKIDYGDGYRGPYESEIESTNTRFFRQINVLEEASRYPPLYYFLSSGFYNTLGEKDLFDRVYIVRFLSLIFFLLSVVVIFALSKLVFPHKFFYQISLTSVVSFFPMYVFSQAGVTPDGLYNLLFMFGIYQIGRIVFIRFTWVSVILFLLTFIAGIATKFQFQTILLLPIFAISYYLYKLNLKSKITLLVITGMIVPIGVVLNNYLYFLINGHGRAALGQLLRLPVIPDVDLSQNLFSSVDGFSQHIKFTLEHTYKEVLPWYFGVYKWLSLTLPDFAYEIINRILLLGVIGLFFLVLKKIRKGRFDHEASILIFFSYIALSYFVALMFFDWSFIVKNGYSFGIQGRYFFPVIFAHLALVFIGLLVLFPHSLKKWVGFILVLTVMSFNYFSLYWVAAHYYDVSSLDVLVRQIGQYKPEILKSYRGFYLIILSIVACAFFVFDYTRLILKSGSD